MQKKRSELDCKLKSKRINPERKIVVGDVIYFKLKEERIKGVVLERSKNNRIKAKWERSFLGSDKFISLSQVIKSCTQENREVQQISQIDDFKLYYESDSVIILFLLK